jgi:hypothetical protein
MLCEEWSEVEIFLIIDLRSGRVPVVYYKESLRLKTPNLGIQNMGKKVVRVRVWISEWFYTY